MFFSQEKIKIIKSTVLPLQKGKILKTEMIHQEDLGHQEHDHQVRI